MKLQSLLKSATATGTFWGIIGGIGLIIATKLNTSGPIPMLIYAPILIAAILSIKFSANSTATFKKLFITGLIAFVIMSLLLYLNIILVENPNNGIAFTGHSWRLLFILALGIISSSVVSFFVKKLA